MKNIGVFFGGKNPEHDISIITGEFIISGLKKLGYNVMPIYLSKSGHWHLGQELGSLKFFHQENYQSKLAKFSGWRIELKNSQGKLVFKRKSILSKTIALDLAFPAFHGQNGEDGAIQGLLEIFNLPYVGCGVAASALAMDKILTKLFYLSHNIPTAEFIYFDTYGWRRDRESILENISETLTFPMFVKPARLGSSIGIIKVGRTEILAAACEAALHYEDRILVENGVNNLMDLTCCVIGNEELTASELQESSFSKDFFSYEDKYINDGGAQLGQAKKNIIIPASLDKNKTQETKNLALKIYRLFDCRGIARVDFLYDRVSQKIYANEVNTLPGTLYHHLWQASNLEFPELLKKLIQFAQEAYAAKNSLTTAFDSNIINLTKSAKLRPNKL